jgi:hypothetical protein
MREEKGKNVLSPVRSLRALKKEPSDGVFLSHFKEGII